MTQGASLLRLMAWLSPVFPTGGFAYSSGLEYATSNDLVTDKESLKNWLTDNLTMGSNWNDAIIFACAYRASNDTNQLAEINALCQAMATSKERHYETLALGGAFLEAVSAWPDICTTDLGEDCPLPVAIGVRCANAGIDLEDALGTYLHAFISNQLQVAIRLSVVGQIGAAELLSQLEETILDVTKKASDLNLDDLGGFTINADICAMKHETMETRIFRS